MTPTHWLQQLEVKTLSLVKKGANKRRFQIYKSHDNDTAAGEAMLQDEHPDTRTDNDAAATPSPPDAAASSQIAQQPATAEPMDAQQAPQQAQQQQQTRGENDATAIDSTTTTADPQVSEVQPSQPQPPPAATCSDPSHEDIATVSKAIQATLHGGMQRQNQRISRLSQELLQLQAQVRQLVKSAGASNAEGMQAQQEQQAAKPQRYNMWDQITDGFGYLRKDVLQRRTRSSSDET